MEQISSMHAVDLNVVTNGVMIDQEAEDEEIMQKLDLAKGGYILAVERLDPVRGFDFMIDISRLATPKNWPG